LPVFASASAASASVIQLTFIVSSRWLNVGQKFNPFCSQSQRARPSRRRFLAKIRKPLKRFSAVGLTSSTGLKPGVNDMTLRQSCGAAQCLGNRVREKIDALLRCAVSCSTLKQLSGPRCARSVWNGLLRTRIGDLMKNADR
jgi:hypothetical protein